MLPLSEKTIRASFTNATRKEAASLTLPADFDTIDWDRLDYLGWRDPKFEHRAYAIVPSLDGDPVGILLRHPRAAARKKAQCSWCSDTSIPNPVIMYSAKRSGESGRNGNTVGVLVCEDFQCSSNARRPPIPWHEGFDVEAERRQQIEELRLRVAAFAAQV
jgi:hypothetical protein